MEIMQMKYFLEVAQTQHITESAERLHIAQPALSQAIKRLEKDLGVPLIMRKGRNIVLTEYGELLQEKLQPLVAEIDALPDLLQTKAKLSGQTIHLNVLAASTLVTEAIIEYQNHNTALNFQLLQNSSEDIFDIEITTKMFYQLPHNRRQEQFVCAEQIYLAVPDNECYRDRNDITLAEVADEEFISLIGSKQFRYICDKFCRHAGIKPHIVFESDNPSSVKNMIAANLGVGFWPEFTWGNLNDDKVKLLPITDPKCRRDIVITCNHNKTDNTAVEDFYRFLCEYFNERQRKRC